MSTPANKMPHAGAQSALSPGDGARLATVNRPDALTPYRMRMAAALVVVVTLGIAGNALLLQRGSPAGAGQLGAIQDGLVTGVRVVPQSQAHGLPIKTAGLAPQPTAPVRAEMQRWQQRLKQLEAEARDPTGEARPEVSGQPAGAVAAQALEPAVAHRLDAEPVEPVTQPMVKAVQRELTAKGYDPGPADGTIGLLTHAAIMAYEHDEGLVLTGEPSERLLRRMILGASTDDGLARAGHGRDGDMAERLIKGVQKALAGLKYAPGRTDGALSDETTRAIREFEMDQGLVPTGRVSGRLIVRLARVSGKAFVVPVR